MMISVSDELLRLLVDRDPCWFDHHGGCQAHGYLSLEPGQICPQQELKTILEKVESGSPEVATFNAADYGIAWPNTPKGIVEEALREYVGDGEGADGAVFAAFVNEVRASAEAEVAEAERFEETSRSVANFLSQKISAFQYSRDQARNELTQRELHHFETEQENEALKAELAEIDERVTGARGIHRRDWVAENEVTRLTEEVFRLESRVARVREELYREYPIDLSMSTERKYARRLDAIEEALGSKKTQAEDEDRRGMTRERLARMKLEHADDADVLDLLHGFERMWADVERLEAMVARMQSSLEACPYGTEGHVLCDCAHIERARVRVLENQASNLQTLVEDLEGSFETLAIGHERSHSSYIQGTEAANEIRRVLKAVADAAAARG